jgi:DNA modification methylase
MELKKISDIKLNPNNPRLIKDDKFKKLVQSIKDFPEMLDIRPIVVNKDMIILGGNMRYRACKEAGIKEIPVIITDLSEDKQREFLIKDNSDSVARLMDGKKANMAFTSPPYNAGKSESLSGNTHTTDNKYNEYNDNQTKDNYLDLLIGFTNNALLNSDYLICNIQSLAGNKIALIEYLNTYKDNFIDVAIWDKGHGAPAMAENVMTSAWEYMFFISSKENASRAIPNANFRGTVPNIYRGKPNRNNEFSNVHAATFPIDLPEWSLQFTKPKDVILDQFCGTGTTMVASHQLNRKCYGMELDPKYCQVIVDRMRKLDPSLVIKKNGEPYGL